MESRITTLLLHCCGQDFAYSRMITPLDNEAYTNRSLEIGRCPKCGALICELIQYSKKHKRFVTIRPKKKDVSSFIHRLESQPYTEEMHKVKYGTKSNMNYTYFDTSEIKSKDNVVLLKHYKKDFNGTIRGIIEVEVDYDNKIYYSDRKRELV